jgi:elongation factor Ts
MGAGGRPKQQRGDQQQMAEITASAVKALREKTGAGMMECKQALVESGGSEEKAIEYLRKRGLAAASKRAGRIAAEGVVGSYIHMGGKVGVLVEVNCETDFVARGEDFQSFVKDVAMHVAASEPQFVSKDEVPEDVLARERDIERDRLKNDPKNANKPAEVLDKIVEGRLKKFYEEAVLLEQPFVKDQTITVGELLTQLIGKIGEKITVRRFTRYKMGEGIEKKRGDFSDEVAGMINKE